jgi:hypothetical protein
MGMTAAAMTALAFEENHVLPEFIAELRDFQVAHAVLYINTVSSYNGKTQR